MEQHKQLAARQEEQKKKTEELLQAEKKQQEQQLEAERSQSHTYWQGQFKDRVASMTAVNTELQRMKKFYEEEEKAAQAAQKAELAAATENYTQQLSLKKKLASYTTDEQKKSNEAQEIRRQLQEKEQAYLQYSESIRQQVEADKKVVQLEEELALARARQADAEQRIAQQYANKVGERVVTMVGRAEIQMLREQWSAAIEYASTYYDKLNEIRVVTGKTEQEAEQIGASYRKLAKEMKVSSTELSTAAVLFYRQGLGDSEVERRLEAVTKYAKIANIEFETAAELVTASTNAMSVDVERVIDVFLQLGDSAATSGEEIGKGMQKAAAAAATFGLDFEWLATYIATVSEQLRTAPETIGNAFNTMMARMHSIKQQGFNSEDETTINDVAKALNKVGVVLMDQSGEWREMDDIFAEIAEKWDTLTDKEKSYIATTMAGTRQQNVFFALMNDMAKGIEGGSRAWELYEKAINSAGTATEKYATWQESVAASQENMSRALEDLYANLQPNLIKGFYDTMAGFVDLISAGTDALNGWNIILPAVAAGIVLVGVAIHKVNSAATMLSGVMTAIEAHPIITAVTTFILAAGALSVAIGAISKNLKTSKDRYDEASASLEEHNKKVSELRQLESDMDETFEKVASGTEMTAAETSKYNSTLDHLAEISPTAKKVVDDLRDGLIDQKDAAEQLKDELYGVIDAYEELSKTDAAKKYNNIQIPDNLKNMATRLYGSAGNAQVALQRYGGDISQFAMYSNQSTLDEDERALWNILNNYFDQAGNKGKTLAALRLGDKNTVSLINEVVESAFEASDADIKAAQNEAKAILEEIVDAYIDGFTTYKGEEANIVREQLFALFYGDDG